MIKKSTALYIALFSMGVTVVSFEAKAPIRKVIIEAKSDDYYKKQAIINFGENQIEWLALNGRYECPSSIYQNVDKCTIAEEVSVMWATINLSNSEGKTIEQIVKHRNANGVYMFSWIPKVSTHDKTSEIYKHSLKLAYQVLGGNPKYKKYNLGQEFYCRESKSPCSWHKKSPNLIELGMVTPYEDRPIQKVSYHKFWARR